MTERITTAELDRLIEEGADVTPYMDLSRAQFVPPETRDAAHESVIVQVSMDPAKVIAIDRRARRDGRTRDELMNAAVDALLATA